MKNKVFIGRINLTCLLLQIRSMSALFAPEKLQLRTIANCQWMKIMACNDRDQALFVLCDCTLNHAVLREFWTIFGSVWPQVTKLISLDKISISVVHCAQHKFQIICKVTSFSAVLKFFKTKAFNKASGKIPQKTMGEFFLPTILFKVYYTVALATSYLGLASNASVNAILDTWSDLR